MKKVLSAILSLFVVVHSFAQVLSNSGGTVVNNTAGTTISGGSVSNSGTVSNAGTVTLSSAYTNAGTSNGNGTYNIGGNWTNSGTFVPGTSLVNFNGSFVQTLSGSSATPFYNVTVNGAGITLSQNASFTNLLTLTNGVVNGADTMTLISNASGTGRIPPVGAGVTQASVTAMFTMQRFENQRTKPNYVALSSSVLNTTVGDWNINNQKSPNIFYMSGVGGPNGNAGSYVSVKRYAETNNTYGNITNWTTPGINYAIRQGEGLYLWLGTTMTTMVDPFAFNTHGRAAVGNVSIGVTYTSTKGKGFNILGNPYPSPIDWATFLASNSTLQSSFYLFEQDGTWHVFTSGSIPMEQGFAVYTSAAATINFQESHKTAVDASLLKPVTDPSDEPNTFSLILSNDSNDYSCPTIVTFGNEYIKDYNPAEDAYFAESFIETVPKLYTLSTDNKDLMLNKLPDADNTMDVPLTAIAEVGGANYTLQAKGMGLLTSYNCVLLIDNASGNVLNNFMENSSYKFNAAYAPQERDYTLRFSRVGSGQSCTSVSTAASDNIQIYALQQNAIVSFHLAQSEDVVISLYNVLGQKLCADITRNVQNEKVTIPLPMVSGMYIVRVQSAYGTTTQKIAISE